MQNKKTSLGHLGTQFFAYAQTRHLDIVSLGELQKPLGLSALQERRLLEKLNKDGFIFRLQRGVYMVLPEKIPAGGFWRPNDYLIITKYMGLHKANYFMGGLIAFSHHRFSTQIPNQLTVYNDKISGLKKFGKLAVWFIKIDSRRIIGFDKLIIPSTNQQTVNIAKLARTILDAIIDWKRYQILPEAYEWLKKHYPDKEFLKDFIELTSKLANNNALRRIGFYLEQLGADEKTLAPLSKKIKPTKAWIALIPNKNRKGKTNKKWRVIDNALLNLTVKLNNHA